MDTNPFTGREIKVNGKTWRNLQKAGYLQQGGFSFGKKKKPSDVNPRYTDLTVELNNLYERASNDTLKIMHGIQNTEFASEMETLNQVRALLLASQNNVIKNWF